MRYRDTRNDHRREWAGSGKEEERGLAPVPGTEKEETSESRKSRVGPRSQW